MNVGLYGTSTVHMLCGIEECSKLFDKLRELSHSSVIDKLYRKVIRIEDVSELDKNLRFVLKENLIPTQKDLINKMLEALSFFHECAVHDLEKYGDYSPLRIIISDVPYDILSDNIPLEDYDNNDGEPFWMRPGYILEHYSKSNKK